MNCKKRKQGIWDDIKDAFKSRSQREEEDNQKREDAREGEKALREQLDALDDEWRKRLDGVNEYLDVDADSLFPTSIGLEKIEYNPQNDDEIRERVQTEYSAGKQKGVNKVTGSYGDKIDRAMAEKKSVEDGRPSQEEDIKKLYQELRDRQRNDSIRRGVGRGSIMTELVKDIDESEQNAIKQSAEDFEDRVASLDEEIANLSAQRDAALEEIDLKYAADVEKQIAKLTKERDETVEKYIKYNNEVDRKEGEYAAKRAVDIANYEAEQKRKKLESEKAEAEYEKKNGYVGEKLKNYGERYQLAYDFYMGLDESIALDALQSSQQMRYYLGYYYDKLVDELKAREGKSVKRYF